MYYDILGKVNYSTIFVNATIDTLKRLTDLFYKFCLRKVIDQWQFYNFKIWH